MTDIRPAVLRAMGYVERTGVVYGGFWSKPYGDCLLELAKWHPDRDLNAVRMVFDHCCKRFGADVVAKHLWDATYITTLPSEGMRYAHELYSILLAGAMLTPEKIWQACVAVMREAGLLKE